MVTYFLKRLGLAIISLFIVITIVFFMMKAIPGLPIERDARETVAAFENRKTLLGLNDPLSKQYFDYIGGLFVGNFGFNYKSVSTPITESVFRVIPYTIIIMGIVYALTIFFGIFFGVLASYYRGRAGDNIVNLLVNLLQAVPLFVLMPVLVWILSNADIQTRFYSLDSSLFTPAKLVNVIWPILVLTIFYTPVYVLFLRNELNDQLNLDYIKVAAAKGNGKWMVIFKHALRNSIIPLMYIIVPGFILIISGSVMAEVFFGIPGYASLLVSSVQNREYNIVLFQTLVFSALYYLLSIVVDILVTFIDPRIKLFNEKLNSPITILKLKMIRKFNLFKWLKLIQADKYVQLEDNNVLLLKLEQQKAFNKGFVEIDPEDLIDTGISDHVKYLFAKNKLYKAVIKK